MAVIGGIFERPNPRVFTIEPNRDFLGELARVIIAQVMNSDFDLSDAIILLPTRRAARSLEQAFARVSPKSALILPRIRTLGDLEPYDVNLCELDDTIDMPNAISPLARKFALAKLIAARDGGAGWRNNSLSALAGADALGALLDAGELSAEGPKPSDWSGLESLVEFQDLAEHWQKSREFLKIVTDIWPQYLEANDLIDEAFKRRQAIELLARNWTKTPPSNMVFIAGSTGAIKATRILMKVVASLPKGAVVLPGLDLEMDEKTWKKVNEEDGSPQRALFDTLKHIGVERKDVAVWPQLYETPDNLVTRRSILNEALTPKEATADWLARIKELKLTKEKLVAALDGISLIEAQSEDEEASAIALIMRETLDDPKATCALVTPNIDVARRVCSKMKKWDIKLDISSGISANNTIVGNLFSLAAKWLLDTANPAALMALLAHPMVDFGIETGLFRRGTSSIEVALLRQARKDETLRDLLARAKALSDKNWEYARSDKNSAIALIEKLCQFMDDEIFQGRDFDIANCARLLISVCEKMAPNFDLWKGETGRAISSFFAELEEAGADFLATNANDAFEIILYLMKQVTIRPNTRYSGAHPRLFVLGPLEARLLHFDKVILAGLDETIWPAIPAVDPFLSRPMRKELGLVSNDLRIGLSAHDFAGFAASKRVVLTRAMARAGSPTVPSRWLWRLKTLCAGVDKKDALHALNSGNDVLDILRASSFGRKFEIKNAIPMPRPPVSARPDRFSATQVETWIRDPYKTYVDKILELKPLDPLGGEVSAKERGSAIHKALEVIVKWKDNPKFDFAKDLRIALRVELSAYGFKGHYLERELIRLEPTISLIVANEKERIVQGWQANSEVKVEREFQTKTGSITLHAKSDRIDFGPNGEIEIWDFKTGIPPSDKQISSLIAPQLPVTALIIDNLEKDANSSKFVSGFGHLRVGNAKPKIQKWSGEKSRKDENGKYTIEVSLEELIEDTKETITKLHESFSDANMAYPSKPRVKFVPKVNYDDMVDRLARRGEWASIGEEGESDNE